MPKPTKSNTLKKSVFLKKYETTLGNISISCNEAKINRSTFYAWMEKDVDFRQQVEAINEKSVDFVESALLNQIKEGNTTATIFFLKTKGKNRGYVERQEITGKDGQPLQEKHLTMEEAVEFVKKVEKMI
jgi:hypothetical protein